MVKPTIVACAVAVATMLQPSAHSEVVVYYSFNSTNAIADIGSSLSAFSFQNATGVATQFFVGSLLNAQSGFPAGVAVAQNNWQGNTNFFQFTFDASGLEDISASWTWQRSATGPTNAIFQYSMTGIGGMFIDFATNAIPTSFASDGGVVTQNLSGVTGLNNNPEAVFRIVGIDVGGSTGTLRIDNFTITAIPEPSTMLLLGLGAAGAFALRRRRN